MVKRSNRYKEAESKIAEEESYSPEDAVRLVRETAKTKFDETVEIHLRTGADPRHAEQQVRGVVVLPNGRGKEIKVVVFASSEGAIMAREAGADFVGDDQLIEDIEKGWTGFDVAIATPDMMGKIGKLGRLLGRKGLMPNPRTGTVVQAQDIPRAIAEAKKGRVEFRLDRTAIIHVPVGKVSFTQEQLLENLSSTVEIIVRSRPSGVKGQFIKSAFLASTMGPSIRLDLPATLALKVE
jgi:large subunit ribosomal protein L1